jgi:hypothetical protein
MYHGYRGVGESEMAAYHDRHTMERMRARLARADSELRTAKHFLDSGSAEGAAMDLIRIAAAPVYLEDVNERSIVMLVTRRYKDQSQFSRYFYPCAASLAGYAWPRRMSTAGRIERER